MAASASGGGFSMYSAIAKAAPAYDGRAIRAMIAEAAPPSSDIELHNMTELHHMTQSCSVMFKLCETIMGLLPPGSHGAATAKVVNEIEKKLFNVMATTGMMFSECEMMLHQVLTEARAMVNLSNNPAFLTTAPSLLMSQLLISSENLKDIRTRIEQCLNLLSQIGSYGEQLETNGSQAGDMLANLVLTELSKVGSTKHGESLEQRRIEADNELNSEPTTVSASDHLKHQQSLDAVVDEIHAYERDYGGASLAMIAQFKDTVAKLPALFAHHAVTGNTVFAYIKGVLTKVDTECKSFSALVDEIKVMVDEAKGKKQKKQVTNNIRYFLLPAVDRVLADCQPEHDKMRSLKNMYDAVNNLQHDHKQMIKDLDANMTAMKGRLKDRGAQEPPAKAARVDDHAFVRMLDVEPL